MKYPVVHIASLALVSLTACIDVGDVEHFPTECDDTSDCNSGAGEVCDDGVCWGDPPPAQYAFVVGPPGERYDLVPTELTDVTIRADGLISDLVVAPAVTLHGRIEAECDGCRAGASIAATIHVRRAARFPGGPEYLSTTDSAALDAAGDSFAIPVPPIGELDPLYQVTILPSETEALFPDGPSPASVVPPLRMTVSLDELGYGLDVMMNADSVRTVAGQIVDSVGQGIPNMRVSALGRVDPLRPLERVSTIATTNEEGWFALLLGEDSLDVVDVVATPPAGAVAPTLLAHDYFIGASQAEPLTMRMPNYPGAAHISVPVAYVDTNGTGNDVAGARVQLWTRIQDITDPSVEAIFQVDGFTDESGRFEADVIAGTGSDPREYEARVVPPAAAIAATTLDVIEVGESNAVLDTIELSQRSTLTGVLVDAQGKTIDGVTVSAVPSLYFLWSLEEDAQQRLTEREAPSNVTTPDGTFTIWVDPAVAGLPASYDLDCEPTEYSGVPRWTAAAIDGSASTDLGIVQLPDGAFVRGTVTDAQGMALPDAVVRVYEISSDFGVCIAENAPLNCQPPAILRASGRTDADGEVRLVLPR